MKWAFTGGLKMFDDVLYYPEDVARIVRNYKMSVVARLVKWAEAERAHLFVDGIFGEAASPDDVRKLEDSYPFSSPILIPLDDVATCSEVFEERRRRVKMDVSREGENLRFRNEELDITLGTSDFSIYETAGIAKIAVFERSRMERLELRIPSFRLEKVYVFEGCDVPHESSAFPGVSIQILEGYVSDPDKFIESYRARTNAVIINKLKPFDSSRVSPAQLKMLETFKSNFEKVMLYESLEEMLDED